MYTELTCGACESYFSIDSEDDLAVWLMVNRFADAHVGCGYMTARGGDSDTEYKTKVIKARRVDDSEES